MDSKKAKRTNRPTEFPLAEIKALARAVNAANKALRPHGYRFSLVEKRLRFGVENRVTPPRNKA